MRPFASGVGSPTFNLAKWLTKVPRTESIPKEVTFDILKSYINNFMSL